MKKALLFGMLLLGAASANAEVQVDNLQPQNIPTPEDTYLNFANSYIYHAGSASETILSSESNYVIGSFRKGSYVVFELNNTVANNNGYTVAFEQNHKNSGGEVVFTLYTENPVDNTEAEAFATYTYSVEAMGDWSTYKEASFNFSTKLPAGTLYMKMTAAGSQSFAGNFQNFSMTAIEQALSQYTLETSVSPAEAGYITGNAAGSYSEGSQITLTAVANTGYRFVRWEIGTSSSTDNPLQFAITEDTEVEAIFETIPNSLNADLTFNIGDCYSTSGTISVDASGIGSTKNKASVIYRFWGVDAGNYNVNIHWGSKYDTTLTVNISEDADNFDDATAVSRDLAGAGSWETADQGNWGPFALEAGKTYYLKLYFATEAGWAGNIDYIALEAAGADSGIADVNADNTDNVRCYNLQGIEVDPATAHGLLILSNGTKMFKK